MSGGSLDGHLCGEQKDPNGTNWLPLFDGQSIVEQPVVSVSIVRHCLSCTLP